jgi:hypothetical protein
MKLENYDKVVELKGEVDRLEQRRSYASVSPNNAVRDAIEDNPSVKDAFDALVTAVDRYYADKINKLIEEIEQL